jgi:hypothetical protein
MGTVIDPAAAIQKKVDVSIEDGKSFSEEVFFLELWSMGDVTVEKTIEVKDEKKFGGTFKQIQFKFDKDHNYIYTKKDNNQKEFDKSYKGTASEFSISGLSAGKANSVIRVGKTNNANDLSELYNGPADRIEVRLGHELVETTRPTGSDRGPQPKPLEGTIDPADGIKLLMPVDNDGPAFSLQRDGLDKMEVDCDKKELKNGILKIESRIGSFASTGKKNWTSRTHARINNAKQITGLKKAREKGSIIQAPFFRDMEITAIVKLNGIRDKGETWSLKFGGQHSDVEEMALSNSLNLPYTEKKQGGKGLWARETTHPKYTFDKVKQINDFPGNGDKITGLKGIRYNEGDGVHYEMWFDADPLDSQGKPRNNWIKAWEYDDNSDKAHTFGVKDVTIRVDMADGVDIHYFNVRSIKI